MVLKHQIKHIYILQLFFNLNFLTKQTFQYQRAIVCSEMINLVKWWKHYIISSQASKGLQLPSGNLFQLNTSLVPLYLLPAFWQWILSARHCQQCKLNFAALARTSIWKEERNVDFKYYLLLPMFIFFQNILVKEQNGIGLRNIVLNSSIQFLNCCGHLHVSIRIQYHICITKANSSKHQIRKMYVSSTRSR